MDNYRICKNCKYDHCQEDEYPCNKCIHNYIEKFEMSTMADKIRKMDDDELIEFFSEYKGKSDIKAWLKSPAMNESENENGE